MTGVDITWQSHTNNFECDSFEIPFTYIMDINFQNITVIKELLMNYDDNIWLKEANEKLLDTMMSWKK